MMDDMPEIPAFLDRRRKKEPAEHIAADGVVGDSSVGQTVDGPTEPETGVQGHAIEVTQDSNGTVSSRSPATLPDEQILDALTKARSGEPGTTSNSPLGDLVVRSKQDPGAPFVGETLKLLLDLRQRDRPNFERLRSRLKAAGIRVAMLDKALDNAMPSGGNGEIVGPQMWPDDEPWPEPVDGAALLDEIVETIKKYLVAPSFAVEAMALWVIYVHTHDHWQISPRLAFTSPEKRCGKTTALLITQHLVPRPLPTSNITVAALFRSIEAASPTLLIDEADTFLKGYDELRGILNSGHNRTQAFVIRTTGDTYMPTRFCTWSPVIIAMIGDLPDTLNDRSIVIQLRRKRPTDRIDRFSLRRVEPLQILRRKIRRWTDDVHTELSSASGPIPSELHDRAADNWEPLFAVAHAAGGRWPNLSRQAAVALTKTDDDSHPVLLLKDIQTIFDNARLDRLATDRILSELAAMEHRPWPEWANGKAITAQQMARLLRGFGISPTTIRFSQDRTAKGYLRKSFEDAFSRYLAG